MPTYAYECKNCKHNFDAFQNIKDEPLKDCPKCGKEVRRLINGGTGIIFKGGGFYVTDKSGKTKESSKPGKSASASADSGAACQGCPASGSSAAEGCPKAVNS